MILLRKIVCKKPPESITITVHASGLLARMSWHIWDDAALTQVKPSPKILATSASSSLHASVAEGGKPPSAAPADVIPDVSTRHVSSATSEFRLLMMTAFSSTAMSWQLS